MLSRRTFLAGLAASAPLSASAQYATSLRGAVAQIHVQNTITQLIQLINAFHGPALEAGVANLLTNNADMAAIAKAVLEERALGLSSAQLSLFSSSFTAYLARKYAPGFKLMQGGRMDITATVEGDGFWAIHAKGRGATGATADGVWMVAFKNGVPKIYNFFWNGQSMMRMERVAISRYYSQADGDIGTMSRLLIQ